MGQGAWRNTGARQRHRWRRGRHVARRLLDGGANVRIVDSFIGQVHGRAVAAIPGCEIIRADIRDPDSLKRALKGIDSGYQIVCLDALRTGPLDDIGHLLGKSGISFIKTDIIDPLLKMHKRRQDVARIFNTCGPCMRADDTRVVLSCIESRHSGIEWRRHDDRWQ